jgi:hypothetical protein
LAANQAGWVLSASGNTISLDVLSGSGHAGPAHMIIGDPGDPRTAQPTRRLRRRDPRHPTTRLSIKARSGPSAGRASHRVPRSRG